MNSLLTGKCEKEFRLWYDQKYYINTKSRTIELNYHMFKALPFDMKYPVLEKYFRSVNIIISVIHMEIMLI